MKRPFLWTFLLLATGLLMIKTYVGGVLLGIGVFLIISLIGLLFLSNQQKKNVFYLRRILFIVSLVVVGMLRGISWNQNYSHHQEYVSTLADKGDELKGTGKITSITETEYGYSVGLKACKMVCLGKNGNEKIENCGDMILYLSKSRSGQEKITETYNLGDRIYVSGSPELFDTARNEGNFDEKSYSYSVGRLCRLDDPKISLVKKADCLSKGMLAFHERIKVVFKNFLQPSDAGIGLAVITGNKEMLKEEDEDLFYKVGVGHVLAISGLHLTVIGMGFFSFLEKMTIPLKVRCLLAFCMTSLFALFTGSAVSALRALYMMGVSLGAMISGRRYDFFSSLGLAGTILLILRPWALHSVSFQYSFLAMLGIGMGQIFVKSTFAKVNPLLQSFFISLAAWLFTLPVTTMTNFQVSWVGIFLNIIVIPLMSPVLILLLTGAVLGSINPGVGVLNTIETMIFYLVEKILLILRKVCAFGAQIPGGSIITGKPPLLKCIVFLLILVATILLVKKYKKRRILWLLPFITLWMCYTPYKQKGPEFTVLDVGQGEGIYINDGENQHFFIDGGSSNESNVGKNRMLPFLLSRRITHIDGWFVSHCDEDHVSGLLEILQSGYKVERLFFYAGVIKDEQFLQLEEMAIENKTQIYYLNPGDVVETERIVFQCYNVGEEEADKNESSLVLRLCYRKEGLQLLLAGDIGIGTEDELVKEWDLEEISIWKATHHGSKYSNGVNILEEIKPALTLISCGEDNRYGHPHADTIERLEDVGSIIYRTDESGQIIMRIGQGRIEITEYVKKSSIIANN